MEVVSCEAKEPLGFTAHVSGGGEKGTGGATGKGNCRTRIPTSPRRQKDVFEVNATGVGEQTARSAVLFIPEYMGAQGVTDKDPDIRQETQQRKGK